MNQEYSAINYLDRMRANVVSFESGLRLVKNMLQNPGNHCHFSNIE